MLEPIALADANNFYVSCERVFDASLIGMLVIVLSNNDGCAVARSEEVKALKIPMGVPLFKIRAQVKKHGIRVLSSNYSLYGDFQRRIVDCVLQFSSVAEVYSIGENFVDTSGFGSHYEAIAFEMRVHLSSIPLLQSSGTKRQILGTLTIRRAILNLIT